MLQTFQDRIREQPRELFIAFLLPAIIFTLAYAAASWHLGEAPDIFIDEILYTRVGIRVAQANQLVWDNGRPMVIHPPFYFLVEALYWKITGLLSLDTDPQLYAVTNIFADVYHARGLNVLIAALTAVLFYRIGTRLRSRRLGLLLAVLFLLDPFGLRTNRRAMLETLGGFLMLAGMGVYLLEIKRGRDAFNLRQALLAGALLGLALLTKDLVFTAPLTLALFGLWEWRRQRRAPVGAVQAESSRGSDLGAWLAASIAALAGLLFPLWVFVAGNWSRFEGVKGLALQRLIGLARLTGWNRPGVSLVDMILQRLADYGTTYLLLALGGGATLLLLRYARQSPAGRFLGTWGLVLYPFYAFLAVAGGGADQYYYYLLLPAILLVGYSAETLPQVLVPRLERLALPLSSAGLRTLIIGLLLLLFIPYNATRWVLTYDMGRDNGYYQLAGHVEELVPPGETLNASGDRRKFNYFFPQRSIAHAATPQEAQLAQIHYFILAPRDIQARYGRGTPELAAWIVARGERLFAFEGESFGPIFLYRVDYEMTGAPQGDIDALTLAPAQGAPLGSFLLILGLWLVALGALHWLLRPGMPTPARQAYANMEVSRRHG